MEQELTNEEIARVFAMYFSPNEKRFINPDTDIKYNGNLYQLNSMKGFLHEYKLLLTPLSAITDEHALQIAKITNILPYGWDGPNGHYTVNKLDHPNTGVEVRCNSYSVRIMINASVYFYDDSRPNLAMSISSAPLVYQYLIKQGYAVPLFFGIDHWSNGKTAIGLGIAIENK